MTTSGLVNTKEYKLCIAYVGNISSLFMAEYFALGAIFFSEFKTFPQRHVPAF